MAKKKISDLKIAKITKIWLRIAKFTKIAEIAKIA